MSKQDGTCAISTDYPSYERYHWTIRSAESDLVVGCGSRERNNERQMGVTHLEPRFLIPAFAHLIL